MKLINGGKCEISKKEKDYFFLTRSPDSVYWKDCVLMLAARTDEVDYEKRNCLVH